MALSLAGVACGTDSTEAGSEPTDIGGDASEATPAPSAPGDASDGADGTDGADEQTAASAFPDLEAVRIADGSTLNLAEELSGGDTPVLLWFWAPH